MTVIEFRGKRYHCPHADLIPRHTAEERDRLDDNDFFAYPVLLYDDTDLGLTDCVLDGHGRLGSASRTGADVGFRHVGEMTTDEAKALAEHIEDDRRHESADAIRLRRQRRIQKVVELRAEGKSLRAIAEEVQVSPEQVRRDIADAGVNPLTPDDGESPVTPVAPETVTGRDGKTYPATRPEPELDEPELGADGDIIALSQGLIDDLTGLPESVGLGNEPAGGTDDSSPQADVSLGSATSGAEPVISGASGPARPPVTPRGGSKVDPDHPHADFLNAISAFAAKVSQFINAAAADSKLRTYLLNVGYVLPRAKIVGDRHYGWQCVGLRGLYRVVKLAGLPGNRSKSKVLKEYEKAMQPEDEK